MEHLDSNQNGIVKPSRTVKRRRNKPGTKALKEIKFYQKAERKLIPVAAIKRVIREGIHKYSSDKPLRIRQKPFEMLHTAVEEFATMFFRAVQDMAIHGKRKTIQVEDMRTLKRVMLVMNGSEDLDESPINPRMSAAHNKTCEAQNKNRERRKRNRDRKKKQEKPATTFSVAETETDNLEEEEERAGSEIVVDADDEWLLGEQ